MASEFQLHPQLEQDTFLIGDLDLCRVLLMNDARYPWCILVPRRVGIREIYELSVSDQAALVQESSALSLFMAGTFQAKKMNVAALGNVVPQLHVHHIARFENDPAWPAPVWGKHPALPYEDKERDARIALIRGGSSLRFR